MLVRPFGPRAPKPQALWVALPKAAAKPWELGLPRSPAEAPLLELGHWALPALEARRRQASAPHGLFGNYIREGRFRRRHELP